jgi:hypothetical protein
MAETAFQTIYLREMIAGFEQNQSLTRKTVTTAAEVNGNTAVFLVGDSNSATAVTRGANGLIPARADSLTQNSCVLAQWHDLVRKPRFNIELAQGDQRKLMQDTTQAVINRKIDSDIITALETASQTTGSATTASLDMVVWATTILGNNEVPVDGNISALITPAFHGYLMKTKEFASVDYVNNKPFANSLTMFRWAGVNFIVHPNLTGKATSSETCLMYHRDAIGHAMDAEALNIGVGYDTEQDYSYARCSAFMGSKLLQSSGVVKMLHDGSGFAAGS